MPWRATRPAKRNSRCWGDVGPQAATGIDPAQKWYVDAARKKLHPDCRNRRSKPSLARRPRRTSHRALGGGPPLHTTSAVRSIRIDVPVARPSRKYLQSKNPPIDKLGLLIQRTLDALEAFGPRRSKNGFAKTCGNRLRGDGRCSSCRRPVRARDLPAPRLELLGTNA